MTISRRTFLRSSLLGAVIAGYSTRVLSDPSASARAAMEQLATDFMGTYGAPGLSIAVSRAGQSVYAASFGFADKETGERLTPKHLFRIASVTKPITSAGIFLLIEQGRLSLGSRVFGADSILGSEFPTPPQVPFVEQVSIGHLLTHTAGGWPNDANDPMFLNTTMNHVALITWTLQNIKLQYPPGTHYAYSNFGYCVLGRVIEKVTQKPYSEFIKSEILQRFGLSDMRIAGNALADRSSGEVIYYGQGGQNPYAMNVARMDSHGGWIATPSDIAAFATHIDGFADTMQLLKPETLAVMATPSKANPHYAKGLQVNLQNNWWHTGSLPGTETIMVRTHSNLCWAAFTNTRSTEPSMASDLDRLIWSMVRAVPDWHA